MRKLRIIRILLATFFLLAVTACFLDFTGTAARWFGWTASLQLMPAALALSLVAVAILVVTLLCGRVYCSVVCPLGILQDIAIFFRRKAFPFGSEVRPRVRAIVRGAIAAVFFAGGFLGLHFVWLEPYAIYGRMASCLPPLCMVVLSAALLALILALAVWEGRFWCNTVCPVGTVLGFLSKFSLLKPKIDPSKCVTCRLCEKACKARSIDIARGTIDRTTCVACFDCGAVCPKGALTWSK